MPIFSGACPSLSLPLVGSLYEKKKDSGLILGNARTRAGMTK
jgi:hypothetical protein